MISLFYYKNIVNISFCICFYVSMGRCVTCARLPSWPQQGTRPAHFVQDLWRFPFLNPIHTTCKPLIARPLPYSHNCAWWYVAPVWNQGIPLLIILILRIWYSSSSYNFSRLQLWCENRTHHLPDVEQIRYVVC